MTFRILLTASLIGALFFTPASAQQRDVPYWATVKYDEMYLRVGPSQEYKIDWVYKRKGMPIKVIRVTEGWRLIRDSEGTQGWVISRQLLTRRSALVVGEGTTEIRESPADNGKLKWNVEPGVVGYLGDCQAGWCEIDIRGHGGWIKQSRLWGTGTP